MQNIHPVTASQWVNKPAELKVVTTKGICSFQ